MFNSFRSRRFFLTAILFFITTLSFSQKLSFCESVDSEGNPTNKSSSFTISSNGGFLEALVTLRGPLNSKLVTYDLFHIADDMETFESTFTQNLKEEYTWFSKKITFHKQGMYDVYVYDERDKLLCVGRVTIKIQ